MTAPNPVPKTDSAQSAAGQPTRVLILEDEEMLRELMRITLEMFGCEVTEVATAESAIQAHQDALQSGCRYSLFLSDLTLRGALPATDALSQMLRADPSLRALLCTGSTCSEVYRNFRSHGFCGRIAKPFEVAELVRAMQPHLGA